MFFGSEKGKTNDLVIRFDTDVCYRSTWMVVVGLVSLSFT